jgi:clan AA aspartic protease (TIGR02281 family)
MLKPTTFLILVLTCASRIAFADNNPNCFNATMPPTDIVVACNETINADPRHSQAYQSRGMAWYKLGEFDRAIDDFTQAIKIDPKYIRTFYNRGLAWEQKGKFDNALSDLRYFAELDPSYPDAKKAIARIGAAKNKSDLGPTRAVARQCPPDRSIPWTDCRGIFTFGENGKYVGDFKNNNPNGQGVITYGGITFYVGEFKDNKYHGRGTMYAPDGSVKQAGIWKEGIFVQGSENSVPDSGGYGGITVKTHGGTFLVPVTINGEITLNFTIDSGASDVSIPADVVSTLIRTGSLESADFLREEKYTLADGSVVPSQTFNIRSLKVGNRVLQNVKGSVASVKGSLLLGQSFLGRFNSWSIDNKRQMLILN